MAEIKKVIYWHRFGQKIYSVSAGSAPVVEKEIESRDIEEIIEGLRSVSGQSVYVLLSDSISYLLEKVIDPPFTVDSSFREKILTLIKSEIPEDFTEFNWDYKVENDPNGAQKVLVFAPIKEFQTLITQAAKALEINIIAIETESIAAIRDPNPVMGIVKKTDIRGRDEEVLNLTVAKEEKQRNWKPVLMAVLAIAAVGLGIFLVSRLMTNKTADNSKTLPTPTISQAVVTEAPTPTEVLTQTEVIPKWEELRVSVQNGTKEAGKASKNAVLIKEAGITEVSSSNAEADTYEENKLVFKSESLRDEYLEKLIEIIPVSKKNVSVDTEIEQDAIFILGNR